MISLRDYSDSDLLSTVALIVSAPGEMTAVQRAELEAINREFERRDEQERRKRKREQGKVRRLRVRMERILARKRVVQNLRKKYAPAGKRAGNN